MGKLPPQSQEEALDEEDALLYAESTLHEEQSEQMLWPEDLFDQSVASLPPLHL